MSTEENRLVRLETKVDNIEKALDKLLNNHLVHLQDKVEQIETKMAYYIGGLAALVFIGDLILRIYK